VHLDASNNGLRNEAILHLVDLLLRPKHASRLLRLTLSRNPISDSAGKALLELATAHPNIESIDVSYTKIPRRTMAKLRVQLDLASERRAGPQSPSSPDSAARRRSRGSISRMSSKGSVFSDRDSYTHDGGGYMSATSQCSSPTPSRQTPQQEDLLGMTYPVLRMQ